MSRIWPWRSRRKHLRHEADWSRAARLGGHPRREPSRAPEVIAHPLVYAASKAMHHFLYESYGWFVIAYRTAAEKLARENRRHAYPGDFVPALRLVSLVDTSVDTSKVPAVRP